ncbi:hypothetical protein [[Eubacterium] cellulosolvens]
MINKPKLKGRKITPGRIFSLFLIVFGLLGTIIWPIVGSYYMFSLGQTQSTLKIVVDELRVVEGSMNETYTQLDDLRRSAIEFEDKFTSIFYSLNESSIVLSRLSIDIERASEQLTQASGSPILLLISEDFANTLSNAAMDLKELSHAFESQSLSLDDIFKTIDEIDDVTRMGVKIIDFIRNSLKSFSVIIRAIAIELESINVTLTTFRNSMIILGLDAALVHFSLLIIGYLIKNNRII